MRTVLSLSLPNQMAAELEAFAKATGRNKSDIRKKFLLSTSEIKEASSVLIEATGKIIQEISPILPACRDPEDDKIQSGAKQTNADYLVTGIRTCW